VFFRVLLLESGLSLLAVGGTLWLVAAGLARRRLGNWFRQCRCSRRWGR